MIFLQPYGVTAGLSVRIFKHYGAQSLAHDAFASVAYYCAAELFGNGQPNAVDIALLRMRIAQTPCGIIAQDINRHRRCDSTLSLGVCFGIQVVLCNRSKFHCSRFRVYGKPSPAHSQSKPHSGRETISAT